MKSKAFGRSMIAIMLLALLAISIVPFSAAAKSANTEGDAQYNIELVIDKSTSLDGTDPQYLDNGSQTHYRYEALRYLFGALPANGNEIGAIVFNNSVDEVSKLQPITSQGQKDALLEQIVERGTKTGGTDIGTSLYVAVNNLIEKQKAQGDNHYESIVLLFTDGRTEYGASDTYTKRDAAIKLARENNIKVFGVFLNKDGADKSNREVFDIVRNVRNRADDPEYPYTDGILNDLDGSYSEIQNADDILLSFAKLVENFVPSIIDSEFHKLPVTRECIIPGTGVTELTIGIRYKLGVLNKIKIEIERPDKSIVAHETTKDLIVTKTGIFFAAKIINPMPGKWTIKVLPATAEAQNEEVAVAVAVDFIVPVNVAAKLVCEPSGGIKLHDTVSFASWLERGGEKVSEDGRYTGYSSSLTLSNFDTQEVKEIPLALNNGQFTGQATLDDYAGYTAYATYSCGDIKFDSEPITLQAKNQLPTVSPNPIKDKHSYNWLFGQAYSVDLSKYVSDPEGGVITHSFRGDDLGATLEKSKMSLSTKKEGVITLQLTAEDDQGDSVDFDFELSVKNNSLFVTIVLVLLLLIMLGGALLLWHMIFGGSIDAKITLAIDDSPVREIRQQMDGVNKPVFLEKLKKPPFSLYDVCLDFIPKVPDEDAQRELKKVFDENSQRLKSCKFKRVPGFDRKIFSFQDGSNPPEKRKTNETKEWTVSLKDGYSILKARCDALGRRKPDGKEEDF